MKMQKEFDETFNKITDIKGLAQWLDNVRHASDLNNSGFLLSSVVIDDKKVQTIINKFTEESLTPLANLVRLGSKVVHINNEQLKYFVSHEDYTVRLFAYQNFEISRGVLKYCIDECLGNTLLTGREIMDVFLRKNHANLTDEAIEILQSQCNDYDCATMWWLGIGDSPIDKDGCEREYDFRKKAEPRLWLEWRKQYIIDLEPRREARRMKIENQLPMKKLRAAAAL